MSEEILKALMQLFAIISKQDGGTTAQERKYVEDFLISQRSEDDVAEYLALFDKSAKTKKSKRASILVDGTVEENKAQLTSVKELSKNTGYLQKNQQNPYSKTKGSCFGKALRNAQS